VRPARAIAAVLFAAVVLAACGESDEEKAQNTVCDARADIQEQVDELAGLTITSASIDQVTNGLDAIRDDLQEIADAQGDLSGDRRAEVEQAGQEFGSQLRSTAGDLVSGATSGEDASAQVKSALQDLAASFRQAYEPVDC
jgi:hypothetical protein